MASIRDLKKDINYICNEIINDGLLLMCLSNEKVKDEVQNNLNEIIQKRNEIIRIIHNPEGKYQRLKKNDFAARKLKRKNHAKKIKESFKEFVDFANAKYEQLKKLLDENFVATPNE